MYCLVTWLIICKYVLAMFVTIQAALVGEGSAEEQLFSSENMVKDGIGSEIDCYFQKLKVLL